MDTVTVVQDVDHLVRMLTEWHHLRINGLLKVLDASEGTVLKTAEGPLTLNHESLLAFHTGIQIALELFEELPIIDVEKEIHSLGPYAH